MKNRKAAFTLAEVLITLGIIGVVAAMTLPTLIQNHQKQVWATSAKKSYAVISNMLQKMMADEGASSITNTTLFTDGLCTTSNNCEDSYGNPGILKNLIPKYLKVTKTCEDSECNIKYRRAVLKGNNVLEVEPDLYSVSFLMFSDGTKPYGFYTNDGKIYYFDLWGRYGESASASIKVCFDINGEKGPNTRGRDVFCTEYCKNGRLSAVTNDYTSCTYSEEELKDLTSQYPLYHLMSNGWKMDY